MGAMQHVQAVFAARGIEGRDFPVAFCVHETLSTLLLAFTWSLCYYLQPAKTAAFAPLRAAVAGSNHRWVVATRSGYAGLAAGTERRMSTLPVFRSGNTQRLTASLAESTLFRKMIEPVSIPGKLLLTLKIMQHRKRVRSNKNNRAISAVSVTDPFAQPSSAFLPKPFEFEPSIKETHRSIMERLSRRKEVIYSVQIPDEPVVTLPKIGIFPNKSIGKMRVSMPMYM